MVLGYGRLISFVKNKNIAILGIGISNLPLVKMLAKFGANVTVRDKKPYSQIKDLINNTGVQNIKLMTGENYLENLNEDIIFKTPGISIYTPELANAKNSGCTITSEMEMFFELCPADIIGVTGSDGKTTTTTLIFEMLKKMGYNCHLGGNIGRPLLYEIENISAGDKVVVELSSFQLQTMKKSPKIAVITNVSPNHLDFHRDMDEYIASKENIFLHQSDEDTLVLNFDNDITKSFAEKAKGKVVSFGKDERCSVMTKDGVIYAHGTPMLNCGDILIPGYHNVENYMAAIGAVSELVSADCIRDVAKSFSGVEHRIEFVREIDGVRFYNDSIASTPTRTRACLNSFDDKVIIIAGGYDKKIPFESFAKDIISRVKVLILIGATAGKIKKAVEAQKGEKPPVIMAESLEDAVIKAKANAQNGDTVVLSPACASFDMFDNFEQRGIKYKKAVMELVAERMN